jgi:hypothetical protein
MIDASSPSPEEWRCPYGFLARFHPQHVHLFASNIEATIAFYRI